MSDKLKKISDKKYTGPKKTFTEKLTKNEIKNLLDGYTETPFDKLHIGHNVRYFVNNVKSGNLDFRMGGFIIKIEEDFVIISNGTVNWSAQKKKHYLLGTNSFIYNEKNDRRRMSGKN